MDALAQMNPQPSPPLYYVEPDFRCSKPYGLSPWNRSNPFLGSLSCKRLHIEKLIGH